LCVIQPLADIWISFDVVKSYRYLSINAICITFVESKSRALPIFHALTGCDTTSSFKGKGKKSAWQAWQAFEEVTETLVHLSLNPFENVHADSIHFISIERFIVVLMTGLAHLTLLMMEGKNCFVKKNRSVDRLPPTQDALLQHVK